MKTKAQFFLGGLLLYLFLSYLVIFTFGVDTVKVLTMEDYLFESLGALSMLIASIMFLVLFLKDRSGNDFRFLKTKRNIFFLVLALLLIF